MLILAAVFTLFHDLFFGRLLATNDIGANDFLFYNYPLRVLYTDALRHGEFLLWAPSIGGGCPVFGEGQGGFLYPLTIVLSLLLPPLASINAFLIIHAIIMGVGAFKFASRVTSSVWSAVPSGVAASICGSLVCGHTRHLNAFCIISLTPWLFYCAERFAEERRLNWAFLSGALGGLMILAGHPQYTAISWIVAGGYLLFRTAFGDSEVDGKWLSIASRLAQYSAYVALATVLAAVIGFPQLRATAENASMSSRVGGPAPVAFAAEGSLPWNGILTFVAPYYDGDARTATFHGPPVFLFWEGFHYSGAIVCVLAVVGAVWGWKRSASARALTVLAAISYLLAVGANCPLFYVILHLPVLNSFRCPARWLLGTEFSLIILASFGMRALFALVAQGHSGADSQTSRQAVWSSIAAFAIIVEIALVAGPEVVTVPPSAYLSGAAQTARSINHDSRLYTFGAIAAAVSAYDQGKGWSTDSRIYAGVTSLLPPNLQACYGISGMRGYSMFALRSVKSIWGESGIFANCATLDHVGKLRVSDTGLKLLRLWHVGTISSIWPMEAPFKEEFNNADGGVYCYSLAGTLPRAWVVPRGLSASTGDFNAADRLITKAGFDPDSMAVVSGRCPLLPSNSASGSVVFLRTGNNSLMMRASEPGLVVMSDNWYPRWRATVDGVPTPVLQVNGSMRGIVAPRAGAVIRMWYDDDHLSAWVAVSLLTLVYCLLVGCRSLLFSQYVLKRLSSLNLGRVEGDRNM